jgi:hypothetical protein
MGLVAVIGVLLSALGYWRDEGPLNRQPPLLSHILSWLPWWAWVLMALAVLVLLTFEGAHRQILESTREPSPGLPPIQAEVISIAQSGGQTARSITNVGLQPRDLAQAEDSLRKRLAPFSGTPIRLGTLAFDAEARRFAAEVDGLLRAAGWNVTDPLNQTLLHHEAPGIVVRTPQATLSPALIEIIHAFRDAGFAAGGVINAPDDEDWLVVADNAPPN